MLLFVSYEPSLVTPLWLIKLRCAMFSAFWATYSLISLSLLLKRPLYNGLTVSVFEGHSYSLSAADMWHFWALEFKSQGFLNLPPSLFMVHSLNKAVWSLNAAVPRQGSSFIIHHLLVNDQGETGGELCRLIWKILPGTLTIPRHGASLSSQQVQVNLVCIPSWWQPS